MSPIYHCPWCVVTERGARCSALMRIHILRAHRKLLIDRLGLLEAFGTRNTLDLLRTALEHHPPLNPGVSGEGDS